MDERFLHEIGDLVAGCSGAPGEVSEDTDRSCMNDRDDVPEQLSTPFITGGKYALDIGFVHDHAGAPPSTGHAKRGKV